MSQPPPPPPPGRPPGAGGSVGTAPQPRLLRLDRAPRPYPLWLAFVVLAIFAAPNLLLLAGSDQGAPTPDLDGGVIVVLLVVTLVLQLVLFAACLLPLLLTRRLDRRLFGPARAGLLAPLIGLVAGIASVFFAYAVNIALALLLDAQEPVEQQLLQDALRGGAATVLAVFIAVVVAPVTEEVIFRGVVFRAMTPRFGLWPAAVVSSAIFAVVHVEIVASQPIALGGLAVVGVVLALAYHYTGSLWVPIVGHGVFNAFSLGLAVLADRVDLDTFIGLASLLLVASG